MTLRVSVNSLNLMSAEIKYQTARKSKLKDGGISGIGIGWVSDMADNKKQFR